MGLRGTPHCLLNEGIVHCLDFGGTPHRLLNVGIVELLVLVLRASRFPWYSLTGSSANTVGDKTSKAGIKPAIITANSRVFFMLTHGKLLYSNLFSFCC